MNWIFTCHYHHTRKWGFTLVITYSVDLVRCIKIRTTITVIYRIVSLPSTHPVHCHFLPPFSLISRNYWCFSCLYGFAFSVMTRHWTPKVWDSILIDFLSEKSFSVHVLLFMTWEFLSLQYLFECLKTEISQILILVNKADIIFAVQVDGSSIYLDVFLIVTLTEDSISFH